MKAIYLESFGISNIKIGERPKPEIKEDEVLIEVAYAGVNPIDGKVIEGLATDRVPSGFPLTPGFDVAGTIVLVGKSVTSLKLGDEVFAFCRKPLLQEGSWAEYVACLAEQVVLKPKNLFFAEAAAIPLAALTAWQTLFDKAHLQQGEKVFIPAGAGGVGSFAIQWAKLQKCEVFTTASSAKFDYVKKMGADHIIDYKTEDFVEYIRKLYPAGIDVALDLMGGEHYKKSFEILNKGGRIVSLREKPTEARATYLFVTPNKNQLERIAELFETGQALVPKIKEFHWTEAFEAVKEIQQGRTTGKIVLHMR